MAVLLTGAAGFIGSHLAARLLDAGRAVLGLDNFDPYYPPAFKRKNVEPLLRRSGFRLVEGDIRDASLFAAGGALERAAGSDAIEAVVHLAARAGVRASVKDPVLTADVNIGGTLHVFELARRLGVSRVLFASSSSVYGARSTVPFREDERIDRPASPYAATKAAGEMLAWTYHHLHGLDVACLRFFTVYGPRGRPDMAIRRFTRLIERGEEVSIYGDGTARRDFTYVDDIVAGVMGALERARGFRIYNLGNSATVEVRELVRIIEGALGKKARLRTLPPEPGDVPVTCAAVERAAEELGYRPSTPLAAGIEKFVAWYRAEGAALEASAGEV